MRRRIAGLTAAAPIRTGPGAAEAELPGRIGFEAATERTDTAAGAGPEHIELPQTVAHTDTAAGAGPVAHIDSSGLEVARTAQRRLKASENDPKKLKTVLKKQINQRNKRNKKNSN